MASVSVTSAAVGRLSRSWPIGLVLGVVTLLTVQRFGNDLCWDDAHLMDLAAALDRSGDPLRVFNRGTLALVHGEESSERAASGTLELYRPLALLTFWLGYRAAGRDPLPQHALNLALHLLCIVLVYVLARARFGPEQRARALLPAAWFGLTPHLGEAHVWISGRFDLLCGACVLLALCCWRSAVARAGAAARGLQLLTGTAFLAALLAKETALFALCALPFWPEERAPWRTRLQRCTPFLGATAVYALLRVAAVPGVTTGFAPAELWLGASRFGVVVLDALTSLLFPVRLYSRLPSEDYAALGTTGALACAALLAALVYGSARARAALPWTAFGLLWLVALLVPVALVTTRGWPGFGRYLYLPASLFFIGLAELAFWLYDHARAARLQLALRALLVAQLCAFALALHLYTSDWKDDETLFIGIITVAPQRSHGYAFLGMTYLERQRYREAVALLRKAVEIAPGERRYLAKFGHALLFAGDLQGARALARDAIVRFEQAPEFHLLEAYSWLEQDPERAARALLECLRSDPRHAEGLQALAFLRTRHPSAPIYRALLERLSAEPRFAAIRPLVRPKAREPNR